MQYYIKLESKYIKKIFTKGSEYINVNFNKINSKYTIQLHVPYIKYINIGDRIYRDLDYEEEAAKEKNDSWR